MKESKREYPVLRDKTCRIFESNIKKIKSIYKIINSKFNTKFSIYDLIILLTIFRQNIEGKYNDINLDYVIETINMINIKCLKINPIYHLINVFKFKPDPKKLKDLINKHLKRNKNISKKNRAWHLINIQIPNTEEEIKEFKEVIKFYEGYINLCKNRLKKYKEEHNKIKDSRYS